MTMYDDIRAMVQMLGGSVGPAGVGSSNLTGGAEIKMRYDVPGPGVRVVSIVPYLIGSHHGTSPSPPPLARQKLLAWQYKSDPGYPAPAGWRCFKVARINSITGSPAPRPPAADLPTLDPELQNCVKTY